MEDSSLEYDVSAAGDGLALDEVPKSIGGSSQIMPLVISSAELSVSIGSLTVASQTTGTGGSSREGYSTSAYEVPAIELLGSS